MNALKTMAISGNIGGGINVITREIFKSLLKIESIFSSWSKIVKISNHKLRKCWFENKFIVKLNLMNFPRSQILLTLWISGNLHPVSIFQKLRKFVQNYICHFLMTSRQTFSGFTDQYWKDFFSNYFNCKDQNLLTSKIQNSH